MENILEIKNLSKKYGDFQLKDVCFELPKGMIMVFIGENGAGNTTTIKAILDIIKNYSGEIKIFGLDNRKNDKEIKEDIGVVLDDMFFPEILTPQNINSIMISMYQNWDVALYFKYLKEFNLPENKQIKTFSKGMRKKLETSSFTIFTKNIKYFGVTLTKQVKYFYDKNFKSLKKEIEEDLKR